MIINFLRNLNKEFFIFSFHIAFGSADHCVHYYDIRKADRALQIYKGHKKAVSYVKFLDSTTLVSASTDSQLKLWKCGSGNTSSSPNFSFSGHQNEKNFERMADVRECNFRTGRILGQHFPEALVHTVHRTRAYGTRPMDSMDLCFRKTLSQNSPRAEIRHFFLKSWCQHIIFLIDLF